MSLSQYYYSNGKERFGPFTMDQLRTKNIAFQTLVWKEGMTDWVQAGKMIELQPLFYPPQISAPPPPPAAFPAQRYQYLNYRDLRHLQEINEGYLTFHPGKIVTLETGTQIITYQLASFWPRVAARLLDFLIILLPSFLFPLIVGWLYWSIQESSASQATIGKKALGIKVLSVNGSKVSFGQATGRFFGNILNVL